MTVTDLGAVGRVVRTAEGCMVMLYLHPKLPAFTDTSNWLNAHDADSGFGGGGVRGEGGR